MRKAVRGDISDRRLLNMSKKKKRSPQYEQKYSFNPYSTHLTFKPDEYQLKYMQTIEKKQVVFVDAPSGTGKTTLAVEMGFEMMRRGVCDRIVYIRFPDDRYLSQGFLPGDSDQKAAKLFLPLFDALEELGIGEAAFTALRANEEIIMETDMSMRGVNMKRTFLIIDEAQNARSISDLQLILTRVHDAGGRVVVIGHTGQVDNKKVEDINGLTPFEVYRIHMCKQKFADTCELVNNYRGMISQWADQINLTIKELV